MFSRAQQNSFQAGIDPDTMVKIALDPKGFADRKKEIEAATKALAAAGEEISGKRDSLNSYEQSLNDRAARLQKAEETMLARAADLVASETALAKAKSDFLATSKKVSDEQRARTAEIEANLKDAEELHNRADTLARQAATDRAAAMARLAQFNGLAEDLKAFAGKLAGL